MLTFLIFSHLWYIYGKTRWGKYKDVSLFSPVRSKLCQLIEHFLLQKYSTWKGIGNIPLKCKKKSVLKVLYNFFGERPKYCTSNQNILITIVRQFDSCGWMFEPNENSRIGADFFNNSRHSRAVHQTSVYEFTCYRVTTYCDYSFVDHGVRAGGRGRARSYSFLANAGEHVPTHLAAISCSRNCKCAACFSNRILKPKELFANIRWQIVAAMGRLPRWSTSLPLWLRRSFRRKASFKRVQVTWHIFVRLVWIVLWNFYLRLTRLICNKWIEVVICNFVSSLVVVFIYLCALILK